MPVPTEVLNEDIRDLRDSNQRLTSAVQDLGRTVDARIDDLGRSVNARIDDLGRSVNARIDDNHREFVTFRVEVVEKLGALNTNLETIRGDLREFQSTVASSISVAKWAVGIATPILVALIGFSFWLAFQAGRLDMRVSQLEAHARVAVDASGR